MAENKTVTPITLTDDKNGDVFVLEFDRAAVRFAEGRGFKLDILDGSVSLSAIEDLFFYAFRMHQPKISKAETDKILYEKLGGLSDGMLERLVELYLQPFNTLLQSDDETKNSTMTVKF